VARIVSGYGSKFFCKRQSWKPTRGTDQPAGRCIIFNSKTNVLRISLVMKPNIDLFYHGDCWNEMLKPLTDKGFK
jgi:hypothetical protein